MRCLLIGSTRRYRLKEESLTVYDLGGGGGAGTGSRLWGGFLAPEHRSMSLETLLPAPLAVCP